MTRRVLLLGIAILSGCVSITPRAAQIQIVQAGASTLASCQRLGNVGAKASAWPQMNDADTMQQAENNMREAAATRYGNVVNAVVVERTDATLTRTSNRGVAYHCP